MAARSELNVDQMNVNDRLTNLQLRLCVHWEVLSRFKHVSPVLHWLPPENINKPKGFLIFSGGIAMQHWVEMG